MPIEGYALFFHCTMLQSSSGNHSDQRRLAFISSFNKADNRMLHEETAKHKYGLGTPLKKVPDSAVLECQEVNDRGDKEFLMAKDRPFPTRKISNAQE